MDYLTYFWGKNFLNSTLDTIHSKMLKLLTVSSSPPPFPYIREITPSESKPLNL
jgi:hypothetical protein